MNTLVAKPRIVIVVADGMIWEVHSDSFVDIVVVDHDIDIESADEGQIHKLHFDNVGINRPPINLDEGKFVEEVFALADAPVRESVSADRVAETDTAESMKP